MTRKNIVKNLCTNIGGSRTFLKCGNKYLLEKIISNVARQRLMDSCVNIITFSSRESYWGFDFERMVDELKGMDGFEERFNVEVVNSLREVEPVENLFLCYPSEMVRRRDRHRKAVDEYANLVDSVNSIVIFDFLNLPRKVKPLMDQLVEVRKNKGLVEVVFSGEKKWKEKMELYGQTHLSRFKEFATA